ncbi:MAG: hypothetical protein Kow0032_04470 [Methyloligellaceae bacterium]
MAKKISGPRIATANRLDDGLVVFLGENGEWLRDYRQARIAFEEEEAARLEAAAQAAARNNIVVDPYLVQIRAEPGAAPELAAHREMLRSLGPTVGHAVT